MQIILESKPSAINPNEPMLNIISIMIFLLLKLLNISSIFIEVNSHNRFIKEMNQILGEILIILINNKSQNVDEKKVIAFIRD